MFKRIKSFLALLLTVIMLFGLVPITAIADSMHNGQVRVIVENTTYTVAEGALWDSTLVDTWVGIDSNSTMMSSVVAALNTVNATAEGAESNYISSINGLAAFEGGYMSGWMGTLNDWFTNNGFDYYTVEGGTLSEGDEIRIMYTQDFGEDLGGSWANNCKTVKNISFSMGSLDKKFAEDTHEYKLVLPAGTTGVIVTPTASNKNFQVRTSIDGTEYKRSATVPVKNDTIITVKCGDPSWPSMNGGSYGDADGVPAETYTFTAVIESSGSTNNLPKLADGVAPTVISSIELGGIYTLDLSTIFADADNDPLTYKVSINGAESVAADKNYSYIPNAAGTYTLEFIANDGTDDSIDTYRVTLEVAQGYSTLASLIIHSGITPSNTNVLVKNASDIDTSGQNFDPNTFSYTLDGQMDSLTQLRFRAQPTEEGAKVTLHYGEESKDITWTSGASKWANCLTGGKNVFTIVVTPPVGSSKQGAVYTFNLDCMPSLIDLNVGTGSAELYLDKPFSSAATEYTLNVPDNLDEVIISALPKSDDYTITYNGFTLNTIPIKGISKIYVTVTAGTGIDARNTIYELNLERVPQLDFKVNTTPSDAIVKVYDSKGASVAENSDGSFTGMFSASNYTYIVTKYGYVAAADIIPSTGGQIEVALEQAADDGLEDVSAYWKNFRGSDDNMAITDVLLPIDNSNINLKWNKKLGTGWTAAPSVQIIVDNALVVMSSTNIYKLDLQTGEILATGTMAAAPNFGYTPPIYAEGMIFAPLTNGQIQAFNAKTLESLWVYKDELGGQSLSPISYSDGYIYTGFWNGETKNANFVCLSVTDEDVTKSNESKTATWKHTQAGGFYWAGSVVVGDAVIVGTDDGTNGKDGPSVLYSFNKYTGNIISELDIVGDQRSTIVYDSSSKKIYFTTKCGYLYSANVDVDTGIISKLKGVMHNGESTSSPLVYKGKVYFGIGSGMTPTGTAGSFIVADAETLELLYLKDLLGYPQSSMLMTTGYEVSTGYIYLYSTYNASPGGITMIKIDPSKNTADGAEVIELYDAAGFESYCISSLICGPDGTLYYKNDSANVLAVGVPQAEGVMKLIDAIGAVTLDSNDVVTIARNAYNALPEDEKLNVTNYSVLIAAETTLNDLKTVDAVEILIDSIGVVKPGSEGAISAARAAYDELTAEQKVKVSNYAVLTKAEADYKAIINKIDNVKSLINAIGTVKYDKETKKGIDAARTAYNALSSEEKALVTNYFTLTAAERKFAALNTDDKTPKPDTDTSDSEDNKPAPTPKPEGNTKDIEDDEPKGDTKVIGDGDTKVVIGDVTYMVDAPAAELMETVNSLTEAEDPDRQDIIDAYKLYAEMSDDMKAQVFNYDDLEALTNKLAVENHKDSATGMQVEGLDWHIQMLVEETISGDIYNIMVESIGNNEIIKLWNISFIDLLTGEEFQPAGAVRIKVPGVELSGYEEIRIAHYTNDGRIEYYDCKVEDGYVIWESENFSYYALIGGNGEAIAVIDKKDSEDADNAEDTVVEPDGTAQQPGTSLLWLWILLGCIGIAVLIIVVIMILKQRKGSQEE